MMAARNPATQGCARLWNFYFGDFGRRWEGLWSPRQESNLYLALRRHLFYPLNYGERIVLTGWNEALLLLASALSRGRFRLFCFVLSEAP